MTEIQKKILTFINECLQRRGIPPTLREIGARCKIASTGSVSYHLDALERAGALKRQEALSRGLELLKKAPDLPIYKVDIEIELGSITRKDFRSNRALQKLLFFWRI